MRRAYTKKTLVSIFTMLWLIVSIQALAEKTYRWTDKNGKVHYSQSVPPSDSQLGHQELDAKNGMTINEVESSEVRIQRKKEEQLEKEKNELNKQALREELMIYMFSSKKELVSHFENRLNTISVNTRLLQFHQKKLKNTISTAAANIKRAKNDKLKDKLEAGLQESQRALIDHSRALETNEKERREVTGQMNRAVKLYDKKYGNKELNIGSLIGTSVLQQFRNKADARVAKDKGMCSCPCTASEIQPIKSPF